MAGTSEITFSKGKSNEQTITGAITAPTKIIPLAAKTAGFSVDDYCFISEADDSELEYLGKIVSIDDGVSVTVTYNVAVNKASGAKFWKATNVLHFTYANILPRIKSNKRYQAIGYTDGGQIYASNKGIAKKFFYLAFAVMEQSDYDNLVTWYNDICEGARYSFEYTNRDRTIYTVRMLTDPLEFTEQNLELYEGEIELREE